MQFWEGMTERHTGSNLPKIQEKQPGPADFVYNAIIGKRKTRLG